MSQAWQGGRQPKNPFTLTDNERLIMAMRRAGRTYKEIAHELRLPERTLVCRNLGAFFNRAIEKERLLILDKRRGESRTSLSVARGRIRMEGTK